MSRRILLMAALALAVLSATAALAATVQLGGLRITTHAQLRLYKLPRYSRTARTGGAAKPSLAPYLGRAEARRVVREPTSRA